MMKVYELYWSWYEDYSPRLFSCKEDKTEKQFKADCIKAMKACFDAYMKSIDCGWAMLPDWIEFAEPTLCSYGYVRIKPIAFGFFGGFLPKDDYDITDRKEEGFRYFPKKYLERVVDYNKVVDKERYKNLER